MTYNILIPWSANSSDVGMAWKQQYTLSIQAIALSERKHNHQVSMSNTVIIVLWNMSKFCTTCSDLQILPIAMHSPAVINSSRPIDAYVRQ